MTKLEWTRMDAKVSPDRDNPVLLIFATPTDNVGIPLRGQDVWNIIKLSIRAWFGHLKLRFAK